MLPKAQELVIRLDGLGLSCEVSLLKEVANKARRGW